MQKLLTAIFLLWFFTAPAQVPETAKADRVHRKSILIGGTALAAGGSLVYLQSSWYSQYNTGKFHFFNDNQEWLQMDKAGHLFTGYQLSRLMMDAFSWAGFQEKQKLFIGGTLGFVYLSAVEVMDGFSRGWGFSWGDEAANLMGTAMAISQEAAWKEQRFMIKYSYNRSGLAGYHPELLGSSAATRLLKDYNAQTYWLTFSPFSFTRETKKWSWLCLSVGYGATGMLGANDNNRFGSKDQLITPMPERQRLFLLSLDIDLTKIRTRSRFVNGLFSSLNVLKFPAPALVLNRHGFNMVPLR